MKNRKIIFSFVIFLFLIILSNICMAKDLDKINKYYITVDPRNDGSLDMTYYFEWKVLDSTSEGPLEWVKIGIPNSNVDMIKALSDNIKSIKYYEDNGDYIRVDFKKAYYENETVNFRFSFHQSYMYELKGELAEYNFTAGWFKDIPVNEIMIFWNAKDVYSASSKNINSDNYYTWKSSLIKGGKMEVSVKYNRYVMNFNTDKQAYSASVAKSSSTMSPLKEFLIIIVFVIIIFIILSIVSPSSYRRHRGFGYGSSSYYDRNDSFSSSCACVSSCACACACAGGGRAGCSKKDFYGITIRTQKLNKIINDNKKKAK